MYISCVLLCGRNIKFTHSLLFIVPPADFACMKEHRQKWETALADWRDLTCKTAVDRFIRFMESDEVLDPSDIRKQKDLLAAEQASVNRRRGELLQQMLGFRPPVATKAALYEWKENIESLNQQLGMSVQHLL